jgi:hypothetical protein
VFVDADNGLGADDVAEADGGEDEDNFTKGILNEKEARNPVFI